MKKSFNVINNKGMWYGKNGTKWFSTGLKATEENRAEATKIFLDKYTKWQTERLRNGDVSLNELSRYNGNSLITDYIRYFTDKKEFKRPSTEKAFRTNVECHIIPYFTKRPIKVNELTVQEVEHFMRYLKNCGRSKKKGQKKNDTKLKLKTVKNIVNILEQMYSECERYGYVNRNVVRLAKKPSKTEYDENERKKTDAYTVEECEQLLEYAKSTSYYTAIALMLFLGLRRGEVLNLRFSDIKTVGELHVAHIHNNVVQTNTVLYDQPLKTNAGVRDLPIPDNLYAILLEEKNKQQEFQKIFGKTYFKPEEDIIVRLENGKLPIPNNFTEAIKKIMKKAEVRVTSPHFLRHTFATLSILETNDVFNTSKALGHADIKSTQHYTHASLEGSTKVTNAIEKLFKNSKKNKPTKGLNENSVGQNVGNYMS